MKPTSKKEIRTIYKDRRRRVDDREAKESLITEKLLAFVQGARTVFCYESLPGEVSTARILDEISSFAKVFVPEVRGTEMDLVSRTDGSISDSPCDYTVVPLIAFDSRLNRIGFGGGYYDRYLSKHNTVSVGIAFDEQQCDDLTPEETDVPLDFIITPTRILRK